MDVPKHNWASWVFYTLFGYPLVMIAVGSLLLALRLMPESDANNEQTVLAWIGLPIWFVISWFLEIRGAWRRVGVWRDRFADFLEALAKGIVGLILLGALFALGALVVFGVLGLLWFGVKQLF